MYYVYVILGIILRSFVFQVNDGNDDWKELIHPEKYGLSQTQNFYIEFDDSSGDKIGAWFVRAKTVDLTEEEESGSCPIEGCPTTNKILQNIPKLGSDDTVIIMIHGNAKNRGASHRVAAYQLFQKQGYHTLTLDPRGYGDSIISDELNMTSCVNDALMTMRFIRHELGNEVKLVIYGHSMGTAISAKAIADVTKDKSIRVDGLILDSPTHSMEYALQMAPNFYYYSSFFIDWFRFMQIAGLEVNVAKDVGLIKCPITILHAEVDKVAPIAGSEKIVEDANKVGKTNIKLIKFKEEGLGHIGISKHEDFPKVIRNAIIDAHEHYKNTISKI